MVGSSSSTGGKNMTGLGIWRETVLAVGKCWITVEVVNFLVASHMLDP